MTVQKERCLKCLMSSIDSKGNKTYDYPNKNGDGPDCEACLDPNSGDEQEEKKTQLFNILCDCFGPEFAKSFFKNRQQDTVNVGKIRK